MKGLLSALAAVVVLACARHVEPAATVADKPPDDSAERSSLLELAHGATVTARTGEVMLEISALGAVDGDPGSFWMTPPNDLPQSMTIALPGRSRIDKVGLRTTAKGYVTANHVTFESSVDGQAFAPMITVKSADSSHAQWFGVKPVEAGYLRVTIDDSLLPEHDVRLNSVLALGGEVEPAHPGDITGCWTINGEQARFVRHGARVLGILEAGREPLRFEGGFDGRIYRLSWVRGNDYGMALLTVSPDGQHLSALNWHEEAIPMFFDTSWFGQKQTCSASVADSGVALALLRRTGRFSLYGVPAADLLPLLKQLPKFGFVAHEFRFPTEKENRNASERVLAGLRQELQSAGVDLSRVSFVAQGSNAPRQVSGSDVMRALYSTVDLEIRR